MDNGTGTTIPSRNRFELSYQHPVTDALGRGWQGFSVRTEINRETLATNTKTFNLSPVNTYYPYSGVPIDDTTDIAISSTSRFIRKERFVQSFANIEGDPGAFGPFAVRPAVTVEREWDTDAPLGATTSMPPLVSRTTTLGYDAFGNVTSDKVETANAFRSTVAVDETDSTYAQDLPNWLIALPRFVTHHSTGPNGEVGVARFTAFDTYASGAVHFSHIEPNAGSVDERLDVETVIDGEGNVTKTIQTDANSETRTQSVSYDSLDATFPATITNAGGLVTQFSYYQGLGLLARRTDPDGATTVWRYDGLGRVREESNTVAPTIHSSYLRTTTDLGSEMAWTREGGGSGTTIYDSLGRATLVSSKGADGNDRMQAILFDTNSGGVTSVTSPSIGASGGATTTRYDEAGRPIEIVIPGQATQFLRYQDLATTKYQGATFDTAIARSTEIRDEANRTTEAVSFIDEAHVAPGRLVAGYHSTTTDFEYGAFDLLRHVYNQGTTESTIQTEMQYDRLGRRTALIDGDSGLMSTLYNAFGDVRVETDNSLEDTVFEPDALGRPKTVTKNGATDVFSWDSSPGAGGLGQLGYSISASGVVSTMSYNATGQLVNQSTIVDTEPYALAFQYDPVLHRLVSTSYPAVTSDGRVTLGYTYSPSDGSLNQLTMTHATAPVWTVSGYSDSGQAALETLGNGEVVVHDYDDFTGQLMHIAAGTGGQVPSPSGYREPMESSQSLTYTYDAFGRVFSKTNWKEGMTETYGHDNLDRLKTWSGANGAHTIGYDYSDLGNLKARHETISGSTVDEIYTYGEGGAGPHALTGAPWGAFTYDPDGRQKSRPNQPLLSYNRFDLPDEIQHDGTSTQFKYDAMGRRAEKQTDSSNAAYMGGFYERRDSGGSVSHVFYVPGPSGPIAQLLCEGQDGSATCGSWTYFHTDRVGNVDASTNDTTGVTRSARDPFGRLTSVLGSDGGDVHLGFVAEEQDDDLGLVNLNHRLYDPRIGRFISPDVLVGEPLTAQGYNRYSYALNSPVMLSDKSGLDSGGAIESPDYQTTVYGSRLPPLPPPPGTDVPPPNLSPPDRAPNGGPENTTIWSPVPGAQRSYLLAKVDSNPRRARDWLTGRPGVFSIPIFGLGSMSGFTELGSAALSAATRAALALRVAAALGGTVATRLEGQVAENFGDELVAFQQKIVAADGTVKGEIDVELENAIIEVTTGEGRKLGQLQKYLTPLFNPTRREFKPSKMLVSLYPGQ